MKHRYKFLTALTLLSISAQAMADPTLLGRFGDWSVYSRFEGSQKICYTLADAKTKSPSNVRHGDIHFLVASWKKGDPIQQPSFLADFSLKDSREPTITLSGANFDMYVHRNEAFIAETSDERDLVGKMRAGDTMKLEATSSRGTNVTYTFSLNGISSALDKAASACQ